MVYGTNDGVIAPKALILPKYTQNAISGATGELNFSGANLVLWNGTNWILISGARVFSL